MRAAVQPKHAVGVCKTHDKQSYTSRALAKAAIRNLKDQGMREYRCDATDGYWHIGHLPIPVRAGERTADEHYGKKADPAMLYKIPADAAAPLTYTPGPENIRALNGHAKPAPAPSDGIEILLVSAEQSDVPQAVKLASRICTLLADLVELVRHSNEERELRERIAELTQQREEALQKLKDLRLARETPTPQPIETRSDQAEVRAWARKNGIKVKPVGQISGEVRAAYEAAMSS